MNSRLLTIGWIAKRSLFAYRRVEVGDRNPHVAEASSGYPVLLCGNLR